MTFKPNLSPTVALGTLLPLSLLAHTASAIANPETLDCTGQGVCLDQITISAQRFDQSVLQAPLSVTTVSGKTLENKRTHSLSELAIDTPGLGFYEEGPGKASFNIRGISSAVGASTVSISLDDISLTSFNTFQVNPDLYDLERVEILRGPQGTLYGEGALGGAIRLISNKPQLNAVNMKLRLSEYRPWKAGGTRAPEGGLRYDGALSAPLIKDRLALRVVSSRAEDGGYIDQPQRSVRNANRGLSDNTRVALAAALSENTLFDVSHIESRVDYGALNRANDQFQQPGKVDTQSFDQFRASSLKLSHSFSTFDLEAISTRYKRRFTTRQEGLGDLERLVRLDPSLNTVTDNTVRALVDSVPIVDNGLQNKDSAELRVVSTANGPLKFVGGLYSERNRSLYNPVWNTQLAVGVNDQQLLSLLNLLNPQAQSAPQGLLLDADYDSDSRLRALYGNLDWSITPQWTVSVGTRQTRQRLLATTRGIYLGVPITGDIDQSFTVNTPRYAISRAFSNTWVNQGLIYLSSAKGFRSGGANNRVDNALISQQDNVQPFYRPDTVWTHELGLKTALLGGRLVSQLAWYRNEWTDVQSYTISQSGLVPFITNVGNAAGNGVDLQLDYAIAPAWTVNFSGAWNQMAFTTDTPQKQAGAPMDYTAKQAYSAGVQYRHAAIGGSQARYRLDYSWRDRTFLTPSAGVTRTSDIVRVLNARAALAFKPSWGKQIELAVYAKNLLNFTGRVDPNFTATADSSQTQARLRPRLIGVEASLDY